MGWIKDVIIRFKGDTGNLTQATNQAGKSVGGFGKAVSKIGPMIGAAFAATAVTGFIKNIFEASQIQAKAEAKVAQAVKQTGMAAEFTAKELGKMASELQKVTTFGDEQILNEVTAQLLTFTNITGDNFKKAQKAALDLATLLDGDLKSASIQLGKALNDPIANLSALSRSGIQFSESQKATIKQLAESNRLFDAQAIILKEIDRQYGGQAEALAKLPIGQLQQMKNAWGDIGEVLGNFVAPAVVAISKGLKGLADNVQKSYSERGWFGRFIADLDPIYNFKNLFGIGTKAIREMREEIEKPWKDKTQWKFTGFKEGEIDKIVDEQEKLRDKEDQINKQRIESLKNLRDQQSEILKDMRAEWENVTSRLHKLDTRGVTTDSNGNPIKTKEGDTEQVTSLSVNKKLAKSTSEISAIKDMPWGTVTTEVMAMNAELVKTDLLTATIVDSMRDLGDSLSRGADTWADFGKSALMALKQVVSGLIAKGVASAIEKSLSELPVGVGLAVGALSGGLAAGMFNTLVPSFAGGGYVSSPTLARIGDAKDGKGEWVLNSDQMAAMGGGSGNGYIAEVKTSYRDLWIGLRREMNYESRV